MAYSNRSTFNNNARNSFILFILFAHKLSNRRYRSNRTIKAVQIRKLQGQIPILLQIISGLRLVLCISIIRGRLYE